MIWVMTDIEKANTSDGKVIQMPRGVEQLHAKLIPSAADALKEAIARRGLSKSDMTNRLIQIGGFIDEKMAEGYKVTIEKGGEREVVHIV